VESLKKRGGDFLNQQREIFRKIAPASKDSIKREGGRKTVIHLNSSNSKYLHALEFSFTATFMPLYQVMSSSLSFFYCSSQAEILQFSPKLISSTSILPHTRKKGKKYYSK